jgi:hypothetical protein
VTERSSFERAAGQDREPDFDLVQPETPLKFGLTSSYGKIKMHYSKHYDVNVRYALFYNTGQAIYQYHGPCGSLSGGRSARSAAGPAQFGLHRGGTDGAGGTS